LTKSQTRRVQRLHHQEQEKERPQGEEQVRSQSVALLALLSLYELIRKFTDTDVAFTK
jgi:prophage antirepressor-like protein